MIIYVDIFLAALNLFCFYSFQNNSIYVRGLNLACCLLISLCTIVKAIERNK